MTSVRLEIEYDGTGFKGWAKQPGLRTVQEELETALETVLREPVKLTVAGRTDTGVHAEGQVASFVTDAEMPVNLAQRLNGLGPRDIAVTAAVPAEDGFDARRDASLPHLPLPHPRPPQLQSLRARTAPSGGPTKWTTRPWKPAQRL